MIARLLIALVRVYQRTLSIVLRGAFGPICRFEPSCSRYAVACLESHGALRGSLLSFKRLCRCSPFHPGGFDPPPPPDQPAARRLGLPANALPTEAPPVAEAASTPAAARAAPDPGVAEPSSKVKSAAAAS